MIYGLSIQSSFNENSCKKELSVAEETFPRSKYHNKLPSTMSTFWDIAEALKSRNTWIRRLQFKNLFSRRRSMCLIYKICRTVQRIRTRQNRKFHSLRIRVHMHCAYTFINKNTRIIIADSWRRSNGILQSSSMRRLARPLTTKLQLLQLLIARC